MMKVKTKVDLTFTERAKKRVVEMKETAKNLKLGDSSKIELPQNESDLKSGLKFNKAF